MALYFTRGKSRMARVGSVRAHVIIDCAFRTGESVGWVDRSGAIHLWNSIIVVLVFSARWIHCSVFHKGQE